MNTTTIKSRSAQLAAAARPNHLPLSAVPSRHSNPFATCWTRPGALQFRFPDGHSAEQLMERLKAQNWWGEILGPHGSGKSTLLAALIPRITASGRSVRAFALHAGERDLPDAFCPSDVGNSSNNGLVVIDGYEQLRWLQRVRLQRFCRRLRGGLLITSHSPTGLPTLTELRPDLEQIFELANLLAGTASISIDPGEVAASRARHGSNVREIFFDLYDRYELARRGDRTGIRFAL